MVVFRGTEKLFSEEIKHALQESTNEENIDMIEFNYRMDLLWEKAWESGLNLEHFQYLLKLTVPEQFDQIRIAQRSV